MSELLLPSLRLKNERREYLNKWDGSQPPESGQPSYGFPPFLTPSALFLMMSPANPLASFLQQGQMGAAGMQRRSARKDADTAAPPGWAGCSGITQSRSSCGASQLWDALTCSWI